MKFHKVSDIEWACGDFRIARLEGLDGPEYDVTWRKARLGTFRSWLVAKMACVDKARMGVAA